MKKIILILASFFIIFNGYTQNVGIGTSSPTEKLEVNGNVKAGGLVVTQGSQYDVVKKGAGDVLTFSKGTKGVGISYIIAITGIYPPRDGGGSYPDIFLGEIRMFAGNYPPGGFMFCNGQLLPINVNQALFSILGTTYGGNGQTTFALPDLRGAVPVGPGIPGNGAGWDLGEVN